MNCKQGDLAYIWDQGKRNHPTGVVCDCHRNKFLVCVRHYLFMGIDMWETSPNVGPCKHALGANGVSDRILRPVPPMERETETEKLAEISEL